MNDSSLQQVNPAHVMKIVCNQDNTSVKVSGARILSGKSRNTVDRPVNRLYPLETNFKFVLKDPEQSGVPESI